MIRYGAIALLLFLPLGCTRPSPPQPAASSSPMQKAAPQAAASDAPTYAPNGSLILPPEYRAWIYLSTGLDMSYSAKPTPAGQSIFDNVFVNPSAYQSFLTSGTWPDKSVFILEKRVAAS